MYIVQLFLVQRGPDVVFQGKYGHTLFHLVQREPVVVFHGIYGHTLFHLVQRVIPIVVCPEIYFGYTRIFPFLFSLA